MVAGRRIERSDTILRKAANHTVARLVVVEHAQRHTESLDMAATGNQHTHEVELFRQRLVVVGAAADLDEAGAAEDAGKFRREGCVDAVTRILNVVDR